MRKSTFLAISAVIVAFIIVSALGKKEIVYEKKETFRKPEEAIVNFIGYINTYEMVKVDNGSYRVPSREFLESISKRYRLYIGSGNTYKFLHSQVPIFYNYEIEEVEFDSIINLKDSYEKSFKNIKKYPIDNNPKVYKLYGQGGYNMNVEKVNVNEDGTVNNVINEEAMLVTIYLVIVNEGEGYVVDYYTVVHE